MSKLFTVVGVTKGVKGQGGETYKVRFATDMMRIKILTKQFADVQLMELGSAMDKPAAVTALMASELYANPAYREAIDTANEKYNPAPKTVKVKAVKAPKATKPSMDAIKARKPKAAKAEVVAEVAAPEASV